MRKLILLPFLGFLFACGDGNPVRPDGEDSIVPVPSDAFVTAARDGVKMVPFKGYGYVEAGAEHPDATEDEEEACSAAGGVGLDVGAMSMNVSHMGKADYRFANCWSPELVSLFYNAKVTAANGDELHFSGPGEGGWEIWEIDWTADPIPWRFGPMTITGGTGRFENATGSFMPWGWSSFDPDLLGWNTEENWEGWISSVGSSK